MTRIVTTAYRYKRPPRKRKAVALDVPTVVPRMQAGGRRVPNAGQPVPKPDSSQRREITSHTEPTSKPAIVTAVKPGRRKPAALIDDGQSDPAMRAWLERAKWGHGPSR